MIGALTMSRIVTDSELSPAFFGRPRSNWLILDDSWVYRFACGSSQLDPRKFVGGFDPVCGELLISPESAIRHTHVPRTFPRSTKSCPATHEAHKQIYSCSNSILRTNLLAKIGITLT